MNLTFKIHTYGCKVNTYDSGLLEQRLKRNGFQEVVEAGVKPQVHVLNTCAVTKEATREAVRMARKIKAAEPFSLVVVTGCAAQVDTEEFTHVPGVDLVVANSHKGQLEELIAKFYRGELRERIYKSNIFKKEDLEAGGGLEFGHTRSFLKIQDGCDSFCTYCVIPFARGKSRSLTIADLIRRIRELHQSGVQEVVLTGVHIADYADGDARLEDLVESLLKRTEIPRLRLSSLEPGEVSARLLEIYRDPRMCPHFHMSIQSANTKVLRDMKRRYDAAAVENSLNTIAEKVPGSYVGMDVIAGFPGETDDEFIDSFERLKKLPWTRLHVFPYSQRPGTFAARRNDQVHPLTIKKRAQLLRELSSERFHSEAERQIGSTKRALVLGDLKLLARDFWPIEVEGSERLQANREMTVKIAGLSLRGLTGQVVDASPR
jgi:threonylcarbamoyladenosine tRNA methylthiotransferase MtaB